MRFLHYWVVVLGECISLCGRVCWYLALQWVHAHEVDIFVIPQVYLPAAGGECGDDVYVIKHPCCIIEYF